MSDLCKTGQTQSPIEIKSDNTKSCMDSCSLLFYYRSSRCNITRDGVDLLLTYDPGSHINFNGEIYELERVAFACPASHKIDSRAGDMEMMLFHKSPETNKVIAISILYEITSASVVSSEFFNAWTFAIPRITSVRSQDKTINMHDNWNIFDAMPQKKAFYTYMGSTVKRPCVENVRWIVIEDFSSISQQSYDNIYRVTGHNARAIQQTNKREIYYNKNMSPSNQLNKTMNVRCMSDTEFREQCKVMYQSEMKSVEKSSSKAAIAVGTVMSVFIVIVLIMCWKYGLFGLLINSLSWNKSIIIRSDIVSP